MFQTNNNFYFFTLANLTFIQLLNLIDQISKWKKESWKIAIYKTASETKLLFYLYSTNRDLIDN